MAVRSASTKRPSASEVVEVAVSEVVVEVSNFLFMSSLTPGLIAAMQAATVAAAAGTSRAVATEVVAVAVMEAAADTSKVSYTDLLN